MKCICCKFDNCNLEFRKHRSNTSFSALQQQFDTMADLFKAKGVGENKICSRHRESIGDWIKTVSETYDQLRAGVYLTKVKSR